MGESVHVFVGNFENADAARLYAEAHWEPEPGEGVSDEEYAAWQSRNPHWPLRSDLGVYLDSDFIETITDADRYEYLGTLLVNSEDLERIVPFDPHANTLVLIFDDALDGFAAEFKSTPKLTYCGAYACDLNG